MPHSRPSSVSDGLQGSKAHRKSWGSRYLFGFVSIPGAHQWWREKAPANAWTSPPLTGRSQVIHDMNATVRAESDDAVSVEVVPKIFVPERGDVLDWTAIYVTEDLIGRTGNEYPVLLTALIAPPPGPN